MSLDSNPQVSPDVEEQNDLSTSSETTNTGSEATEEETAPSVEESTDTAEAEPSEASTEEKVKKPRKPRQKSQMRELEDRILNAVDQRLASTQPPTLSETKDAQPAQAAVNPSDQLFMRKVNSFNDDLETYRRSSDKEEQAIARTIDDMLAGRNALADVDLSVKQQLVMDGITPDELHDLNEHYGDQLVPQAPEVEYRTIKRYLRQIRSGNVPNQAQGPKARAKAPVAAIGQVSGGGGGGGMKREKSPSDIKARMLKGS